MPPATPSPHRFLRGRRNQSPAKEPRHGPSSLRKQVPVDRGDGFADAAAPQAQQTPKPTKVTRRHTLHEGDGFQTTPPIKSRPEPRQFAHTPKFSHGRLTPATRTERSPSPQKHSLVQALRASGRPGEDVEEATGPEHEDEMMLDVEQHEAIPTIETSAHTEIWINDLAHSPKRRKIEDIASPPRPVFKHPTTPASALAAAGAHQFSRAASVATSIADDSSTSTRRPAFLRSSLAPTEQHEPLPEAFSPHRRGEKFVPGGMAATLQQWVVEKGQEASASRRGQGYLRGEAYVLQVEVQDVRGRGPVLVSGRGEEGEEVRVVLVVDGKQGGGDMRRGCRVGIRAPTWNVEVEGGTWAVGVDWKVLS